MTFMCPDSTGSESDTEERDRVVGAINDSGSLSELLERAQADIGPALQVQTGGSSRNKSKGNKDPLFHTIN